MFLHLSVIFTPVCNSVLGEGVCPIACWDTPPGTSCILQSKSSLYIFIQFTLFFDLVTNPNPYRRKLKYYVDWRCVLKIPPPGADTPRQTLPRKTPPGQTLPLGRHPSNKHPRQTPPLPEILRDTINKRTVRILLECILVITMLPERTIETKGNWFLRFVKRLDSRTWILCKWQDINRFCRKQKFWLSAESSS